MTISCDVCIKFRLTQVVQYQQIVRETWKLAKMKGLVKINVQCEAFWCFPLFIIVFCLKCDRFIIKLRKHKVLCNIKKSYMDMVRGKLTSSLTTFSGSSFNLKKKKTSLSTSPPRQIWHVLNCNCPWPYSAEYSTVRFSCYTELATKAERSNSVDALVVQEDTGPHITLFKYMNKHPACVCTPECHCLSCLLHVWNFPTVIWPVYAMDYTTSHFIDLNNQSGLHLKLLIYVHQLCHQLWV